MVDLSNGEPSTAPRHERKRPHAVRPRESGASSWRLAPPGALRFSAACPSTKVCTRVQTGPKSELFLRATHERERGARAPARVLDDGVARREQPVALGALDHRAPS